MAFKPYNFKLNSENSAEAALIERIESAENKSSLFKAALYHYFEMPPPPPQDAPVPVGPVDSALTEAIWALVTEQQATNKLLKDYLKNPPAVYVNREAPKASAPAVETTTGREFVDDSGETEPLGYQTADPDEIMASFAGLGGH